MRDFRVILFSSDGEPRGELSQAAGTLRSCVRTEEINGEHSLSLTADRHLEIGTRALTHHSDGRWREWVVDEAPATHDTGEHALVTYHLCWSLQYDLKTVYGPSCEIGMTTGRAQVVLAMPAAIDGTMMWNRVVYVGTQFTAPFVMNFGDSAWDRLCSMAKYCPIEFDALIDVSGDRVTARTVVAKDHLGTTDAIRRLEWGRELVSLNRTPDPGPYACRLLPLGNGETEEAADGHTTYSIPLDISEASVFVDSERGIRHDSGSKYIRDTESEVLFKKLNLSGDYEYPVVAVTYSTDDPEELLAMAREDVLYHTRPGVSYSGTVTNLEKLGLDTDGIGLGDEVQIVDWGFNPNLALRVQERVLRMEVDELGIEDGRLDIGRLVPKLERTIATVAETVGTKAISYNTPRWDSSKYDVDTPELSHQAIEVVGGEPYVVPTVSYDIPDYGSAISDLQNQVAGIYNGDAYGTTFGGGDDWVHQINGTSSVTGTINFITDGSAPSSDPKPSTDDWGTAAAGIAAGAAAAAWGTGGGGAGHSF